METDLCEYWDISLPRFQRRLIYWEKLVSRRLPRIVVIYGRRSKSRLRKTRATAIPLLPGGFSWGRLSDRINVVPSGTNFHTYFVQTIGRLLGTDWSILRGTCGKYEVVHNNVHNGLLAKDQSCRVDFGWHVSWRLFPSSRYSLTTDL